MIRNGNKHPGSDPIAISGGLHLHLSAISLAEDEVHLSFISTATPPNNSEISDETTSSFHHQHLFYFVEILRLQNVKIHSAGWVATALLQSEKKFRKVRGHKSMSVLVSALEQYTKQKGVDNMQKVA